MQKVDAVVLGYGKVAYMGCVIYRKCNGACVVVRYGKIVHVGSFIGGKCKGGWVDFHGILPGNLLEMKGACCGGTVWQERAQKCDRRSSSGFMGYWWAIIWEYDWHGSDEGFSAVFMAVGMGIKTIYGGGSDEGYMAKNWQVIYVRNAYETTRGNARKSNRYKCRVT